MAKILIITGDGGEAYETWFAVHRFQEAGAPPDGVVTFTLHAFLRGMGRRADGRTYEQLRTAPVVHDQGHILQVEPLEKLRH